MNDSVLLFWLINWAASAFALWLTALIMPGFRLKSYGTALIAALALGLVNTFVKPVLIFLTFPLTILTLGLFLFIVNAIVLRLAAAVIKDFEITNWFSAIFGAILLSLVSSLINALI